MNTFKIERTLHYATLHQCRLRLYSIYDIYPHRRNNAGLLV